MSYARWALLDNLFKNCHEETPLCPRKQPSTTSNRQNIIPMPRVTTVKQPSIMRADFTKKRPIMRTLQGDMRFTLGIILTKLPRLIWKSTARNRFIEDMQAEK